MKSLLLFPDEASRRDIDDGFHASTGAMILGVLNQGVVNGISFDELSRRLTIRKAVRKVAGDDLSAGGELILDDADAEVLQRLTAATQWGVLSDVIPSFVDAVRGMAPWSPPS